MVTDCGSGVVCCMLGSRPGLDLKPGRWSCSSTETCSDAWPGLAIHQRWSLLRGWSDDELTGALMHLCGYIGLPAVREAMIIAKGVFAEMRAEPEGGLAGA